MQKKFHFWYRLFGFTKDQGFLRNQTSCNSTNKQVCKLRIEVSFEINFVKTSHFCTSTGYFEREKKYIGILNIFVRDFFFTWYYFFVFSVSWKIGQYFHIKFWLQLLRMRRVFRLCYLEHDQKLSLTQTNYITLKRLFWKLQTCFFAVKCLIIKYVKWFPAWKVIV